jgi:RecB family exonuclease
VKLLNLSFRENPVGTAAALIGSGEFDPLSTLVVTPTQRFKSYLASALLERSGGKDLLCPSLVTAQELGEGVLSALGLPPASEMERLSLLSRACARTPEIETLFPKGFAARFSSFREAARRLLRAFDELNREEIDFESLETAAGAGKTYGDFMKHAGIFKELYGNYLAEQDSSGAYDKSFLIGRAGAREVGSALDGYERVLLIEPVSLTRFERRVLDLIHDRLVVIVQDTPDYDFSGVLTLVRVAGGKKGEGAALRDGSGALGGGVRALGPAVFCRESPSRVAQLTDVLAVIDGAIAEGTPPREIAVINIDTLFCEMLRESLDSLGIESNISGGVSFKKSPLYGFLNLAGEFFSSLESKHFLELLAHPLFPRIAGYPASGSARKNELEAARRAVVDRRLFRFGRLSAAPLRRDGPAAKAFSFLGGLCGSRTFSSLASALESLFGRLAAVVPSVPDPHEGAVEFEEAKEVALDTAIALEDCDLEVKETPFEVLLERLRGERLPVPGSHLDGVQIIGLLESRGLCFTTVIVPTLNEGFFPSRLEGDVLLSLELRRSLGLPTPLDGEELELYYLKRIVDSSSSSHLLSIADASGEIEIPSRYISLLAGGSEGSGAAPGPSPSSSTGETAFDTTALLPLLSARRVEDGVTEACYDPLVSLPVLPGPLRAVSRWGVDTLKKCETKYYIAEVLGVKPEKTLVRGVEPDLVGNKVHALFKELYGACAVDALPERFSELFDSHFPEGLFDTGEEPLFRELLRSNLLSVLGRDIERFRQGFRVCGELTETELSAEIDAGPDRCLLKGRIDRVDRSPGEGYLIVDYKTGRLPRKADHFEEKGFKEVQLGFYGLLFRKNYPGRTLEGLGYIDVGERRDLEIVVKGGEVEAYLDAFERHLSDFLRELNERKRLSLTEDPINCVHCPYPTICRVGET